MALCGRRRKIEYIDGSYSPKKDASGDGTSLQEILASSSYTLAPLTDCTVC